MFQNSNTKSLFRKGTFKVILKYVASSDLRGKHTNRTHYPLVVGGVGEFQNEFPKRIIGHFVLLERKSWGFFAPEKQFFLEEIHF